MTSLPGPEFEALIRPHVGDPLRLHPVGRGHTSDVAAMAHGAHGSFFVKAVRNRPGGRRDSLVREGQINPYVRPISPAVRWRAESEDWVVLGFEAIDGRPADFTPGSPDLPRIVGILNRIAAVPLPEIARDWVETRWDRYVTDPSKVELLRGDALLYTDIQPDNLLIGADGAWAVDWAWPTRGAAFIDPACLVVQLVAAGHTPGSAEAWASRCVAWASADPRAVDAFAAAMFALYGDLAARNPDAGWLKAMAAAAEGWVVHRGFACSSGH
ncbi:hypothetical protein Acsp03_62000 [Actinomadura sp. NBRC 104412]|uniref:protein kinase n=1 Tax=Actinomadura sp. NBRC 104412 TaxID=3032203 RepID=UPI0024A1FF9C|nr:protein kinase [Actinomadura sp. NBRC 104412]GLZ08734.1 hypothetical protein Acsp03_62000 [Actinomadura sp. NBRC 104412]